MSKGTHLRPPVEALEPDGYKALVLAIVKRAVDDARGDCALTHGSADQCQAEAVAWLQDAAAVQELLELAGFDSTRVVERVRQLLARQGAAVPQQLALFGA
jgi:hypothetical protein